jgi:hypothetical protein
MKNNGTVEVEFKENTDYFRMSDGVFWTIEALARKYNSATNTIYKKGKELEIATMNVLGIKCFKDDLRFEKSKGGSGNIEHLQGKQITTYAQLHRKVEEATEAMAKSIGEMFAARVQMNFTNDQVSRLTHFLQNMNEIIVKNEETLNAILSYLTKGEKKDG